MAGLYDGLPYELQSPSFRNAMNNAGKNSGTWDPSLSQDMAIKFLDAQVEIARASASPGVNTAPIDGKSNFVDNLSGLGIALLQSIGVQPEQSAAQAYPAAYQPQSTGPNLTTLIVLGLFGIGAYVAFGKG